MLSSLWIFIFGITWCKDVFRVVNKIIFILPDVQRPEINNLIVFHMHLLLPDYFFRYDSSRQTLPRETSRRDFPYFNTFFLRFFNFEIKLKRHKIELMVNELIGWMEPHRIFEIILFDTFIFTSVLYL